jgi:hypothetical protein
MNRRVAQSVVELVNREIGSKLTLRDGEETTGDSILCVDERRRRVAIVCYHSQFRPIVRSVIRERVAGRGFNWLCNGQAGTNAIELVRWEEDHRYYCTPSEAVSVLKDLYGDRLHHVLTHGPSALPSFLSFDAVKAAYLLSVSST